MSKMNPKRPAYTLHKPTGQARVRLGGKDHYLGEFDSPNSHELYQKLVDHWLQNQEPIDKSSITIDRLCLEYLKFVDQHYRKNGKPTSEPNNIRIALRYLISAHGPQLARQFGPKALKDVSWRPNDTSDWRFKRYQLNQGSRCSSLACFCSPETPEGDHDGSSTEYGQVVIN